VRNSALCLCLRVALLCLCAGFAHGGALEDAVAARDRGDFARAVQLLTPLAQQGDAASQFQLSLLYRNGQGVPINANESLRWLRQSAHGGYAAAQSNLGAAYSQGRGVPQNHRLAYVWLSAGAAGGSREAASNLAVVQRRMTPTEISQARDLADACAQRHFAGCD
jgi:hypothetical protein